VHQSASYITVILDRKPNYVIPVSVSRAHLNLIMTTTLCQRFHTAHVFWHRSTAATIDSLVT